MINKKAKFVRARGGKIAPALALRLALVAKSCIEQCHESFQFELARDFKRSENLANFFWWPRNLRASKIVSQKHNSFLT